MSVRFCSWYTNSRCPLECDWEQCPDFIMDDIYKDKVIVK